jgi:DNA (cytosine-5)-methyltransferase 1
MHCSLSGHRNYGDISKIDWSEVPDFDLFTYSSPCQDFSNAGLQRGGAEGSGTRSSLLWECRRAIVAKRPKYLLLENVAALVSAKFLPTFNAWQSELASYGYSNFAKVLNAKDYGVPQNRERIFLVSILDENVHYHFPKPFELKLRLKDVLEEKVDEKYYLSDETVQSFMEHCNRKQAEGCGFRFEPSDGGGYAKCISTKTGSRQTDNFLKEDG